jgi:formamidopyrimidine-DNA glycosylase
MAASSKTGAFVFSPFSARYTLSEEDRKEPSSLKSTPAKMVAKGGRDTEVDLHGRHGGYRAILSKNTVGKPCPACGTTIKKEAYLGGSIYYCPRCQKM